MPPEPSSSNQIVDKSNQGQADPTQAGGSPISTPSPSPSLPPNPETKPQNRPEPLGQGLKETAKKNRWPAAILLLIVVLIFIFWAIYFLTNKLRTRPPALETGTTPLSQILEDVQKPAALDGLKPETKELLPARESFGRLASPDLSRLEIKGLSLLNATVSYETTQSATPENNLLLVYVDPLEASGPAFFSQSAGNLSGLPRLSADQIVTIKSNNKRSFYPIVNEGHALNQILGDRKIYGLAAPKTDWQKTVLKYWQIKNVEVIYWRDRGYFWPLYLFEGQGLVSSLETKKESPINLQLLVEALKD